MKHRRFITRCSSEDSSNSFNNHITSRFGRTDPDDLLRRRQISTSSTATAITKTQQKMKNASNLLNFYLKQGSVYDTIFLAAHNGDADYLKSYFNLGGNVNQEDTYSRTCLHIVCCNGYYEAAETLIKLGADVNKKDKNGNAPLHLAIICSHFDIVGLLVKNGAQIIYESDKIGEGPKLASPLSMAATRVRMLKKQSKSLLVYTDPHIIGEMEGILELLKYFSSLQSLDKLNIEGDNKEDEEDNSIMNSLTKMTEKLSLTKQSIKEGKDSGGGGLEKDDIEALLNETDELMNKISLN